MRLPLALLLLCAVTAAQAQMYKWKDDKGVTHYADTPPSNASAAALKSYGAPSPSLPYELAEPVKARPIVLYTTTGCAACDEARTMLRARGIPFAEKTVNTPEDHAALKSAGSNGQLPLLVVGRTKTIGFERLAWDTMLTDAGYPLTRILPPGYQWPAPSPAAPQPVAADRAVARTGQEAAPPERKQPDNAPPGFQF